MEAEFIIDAGHKYFLDWLEAYASKYGSPNLHSQDTNVFCGINHPVIIHEGGWILTHAPATMMKAVGDDDDTKFIGEEIEPFIRFNLLPLSETRTKIVALWYETPEIGGMWHAADNNEIGGFQAVDDYMRHLLGMIANDWPEAKGSIEQALSTNIGTGATLNEDRITLGGGYSEEILVPIDVLDVSVSRRIEGYTAELATAEREEIIPGGRVIYRLSWREFGQIGEVELHKSGQNNTWLSIRYVEPADRKLRENIKQHMDLVMRSLHAGLAEDDIWEKHERELERREEKEAAGGISDQLLEEEPLRESSRGMVFDDKLNKSLDREFITESPSLFSYFTVQDIDQVVGITLKKYGWKYQRTTFADAVHYVLLYNEMPVFNFDALKSTSQIEYGWSMGSAGPAAMDQKLAEDLTFLQDVISAELKKLRQYAKYEAGFTSVTEGTKRPARTPVSGTIQLTLETDIQNFEKCLTEFTDEFSDETQVSISPWSDHKEFPVLNSLDGQGWDVWFETIDGDPLFDGYGALFWISQLDEGRLLLSIPPSEWFAIHFIKSFLAYTEERWSVHPSTEDPIDDIVRKREKTEEEPVREINLQTKPAGRRPDPDYDEAFGRISRGEDEKEVFKWFCAKKGWSNPGKSERAAFKQAMKRRRKGTK